MNSRLALAATASLLALAGCSGGGGGAATQVPGGMMTPTALMTPTAMMTTSSMMTPNQTSTSMPAAKGGGAVAGCSMISAARASSLLGAAATGKMANVTADASIKKIDGCNYTSTAGSLGYDVNQIVGMSGIDYIGAAKEAMAAEPGVTIIPTTGGDASVGFVVAVGAKTMVRIEIAKGDTTIGVAAVGADKALMQSVALAAASDLVGAV